MSARRLTSEHLCLLHPKCRQLCISTLACPSRGQIFQSPWRQTFFSLRETHTSSPFSTPDNRILKWRSGNVLGNKSDCHIDIDNITNRVGIGLKNVRLASYTLCPDIMKRGTFIYFILIYFTLLFFNFLYITLL